MGAGVVMSEIERLRIENKHLKKVIEFYADNWVGCIEMDTTPPAVPVLVHEPSEELLCDCGDMARDALEMFGARQQVAS